MKTVVDFEGVQRSLPLDDSDSTEGLTLIPALIDPHVHFRCPGFEHKEDWESAARACIAGGFSQVFEMPNTNPPCTTKERLFEKKRMIDQSLKEVDIPLRYELYFGACGESLKDFEEIKGHCKMLKIFMGASSKELVVDEEAILDEIFKKAAELDLVVAVHAESDKILQQRKKIFSQHLRSHFKIHDRSAALDAVGKVLALAAKYQTKLYLLHISTQEELKLIEAAKKRGVNVLVETCPHYLFLTEHAFFYMGSFSQVNPPLRTKKDQQAIWEAIDSGLIDTIGSDHAPHLPCEKKARPVASGFPGLETTLPLLLNARHEGMISLEKIVSLCRRNIERFFGLEPYYDWVLLDLEKEQVLKKEILKTRAAWSPYIGRRLKGWPVLSIIQGRVYALNKIEQKLSR